MEILESDNGFAEAKNEEVQNENTLSNYNIYRKLCYHDIFYCKLFYPDPTAP